MAREERDDATNRDLGDVVSVIGPGMEIVGDIKSDGTVRVEGRVEGSIKAAKSVVVGREGTVDGDIETQDVVVAGRISGTVYGESRVELKDTCHVNGDIRSRRIKLDEGGQVEGSLQMGENLQRAGGGTAGKVRVATPSSSGSEGAGKGSEDSGSQKGSGSEAASRTGGSGTASGSGAGSRSGKGS